MQCGILDAISKKHFRYSLFVKRIIAIDGTTSLFGLGQTIISLAIITLFVSSEASIGGISYQKRFKSSIYCRTQCWHKT